jgi:hypothetical protein
MRLGVPLSAAFMTVLVPTLAPTSAAERTFVGRKLPALAMVDTEGHTIRPSHYEGSVFVMVTGIPW